MKAHRSGRLRCAIYTRVSTEHGLEQEFNSLDNQREAAEAYIKSQAHEGWTVLKTPYDDGGFSGASMNRPSLQQLLSDIRARKVDVVVVYKVDRLTRSLADFAKLVEDFDRHGVSFVSVTQAFNTTTSMGRLTLNVLLSFAQFEREVTSERIRDKIAASKKRGLWMGGTVPLGYESRDKKLVVVEHEAEQVRLIFQRYAELASLDLLMRDLRQRGILSKVRRLSNGRTIGGIPFTRGPLAYLLRNRFYIGEVAYRGSISQGEHTPILDRALFEAVQHQLALKSQCSGRRRTRSGALLMGKLFDERGNRMTPAHANKGGARYRYYVSCALHQGRSEEAGSVARVSAPSIEATILGALRERSPDSVDDAVLIDQQLDRATLKAGTVEIVLRGPAMADLEGDDTQQEGDAPGIDDIDEDSSEKVICLPWSRPAFKRRREIIRVSDDPADDPRPIRAERRASLVRAVALGRRWLSEIADGSAADIAAIAEREGCSKRHVAMTVSLAFVSPDLVEAAVAGQLPRGVGLRNAVDLPMEWSRQHRMLGL